MSHREKTKISSEAQTQLNSASENIPVMNWLLNNWRFSPVQSRTSSSLQKSNMELLSPVRMWSSHVVQQEVCTGCSCAYLHLWWHKVIFIVGAWTGKLMNQHNKLNVIGIWFCFLWLVWCFIILVSLGCYKKNVHNPFLGGQFETYNLLNFTHFIGAICLTVPTSCGKATIRKGLVRCPNCNILYNML